VALTAQRAGWDLADEERVASAAASLDAEFHDDRVWLAGEDVSDAIRTEECSAGASRVAAYPAVREALVRRHRE